MNFNEINSLRIRLADLYRIKDESKGEKIVRLQENLGISYQFLKENYDELCATNDRYLADHGIEQQRNTKALERFLLHFQKRTH